VVLDDLRVAISQDSAAHRVHLLPGIEIHSATIESAAVAGTTITIVVRLHLIGKNYYADPAGTIVVGDDEYHQWDEDWSFVKDTKADESAEDRAHALLPEHQGGWDFAHLGWNSTKIERVTPGSRRRR
jgi:hypothetical protein